MEENWRKCLNISLQTGNVTLQIKAEQNHCYTGSALFVLQIVSERIMEEVL